jgi:transposase
VTKAVDKVRRGEHKALATIGDQRLKGTKHLWLWNEENIPECRQEEFSEVKNAGLNTSRA